MAEIKCPLKVCKAECCGVAPMPAELFEQERSRLQRQVVLMEFPGNHVGAVDENMVCGFLTVDHQCAIYDRRPEVCRKFGDPSETHPMLKCPHLGQCKKEPTP